jgi:hypothetical protein
MQISDIDFFFLQDFNLESGSKAFDSKLGRAFEFHCPNMTPRTFNWRTHIKKSRTTYHQFAKQARPSYQFGSMDFATEMHLSRIAEKWDRS